MGADAYLTKPFSNADLLATVAQLAQARAESDQA
jgi:DNA-binding response OmpR family regulator